VSETATINVNTQIGVESTPGTSVAANKLLRWGEWKTGIETEVKTYRGTGRKYAISSALNKEWTSGSVEGPLDYNALIYPLNGALGTGVIAAALASVTAKTHTFTPPISGNTTLKTFTMEQGDSVRAHKCTYGLFNGWGYKGSRDEFTFNADYIGQLTTDGITMTGSPTAIALAPSTGNQYNLWMDTTSGALGTTQLTRPVSVEFSMSDIYGPAWFINRSMTSWTTHIDLAPKTSFKFKVEADAAGMGPLVNIRAGDTRYLRLEAQGNQIAADGPGAIFNTFSHDMAVKFIKVSPWDDEDGIYVIEWECQLIEDPAWSTGLAQKVILTNSLTAL